MMIEIGPNLTLAIQFVSVVCDVISFVLLLYLWRKSEQLQKENEQLREQAHYHYENGLKKDVEIERLREALQTIAEEDSGWGQYVAFTTLKERE